MQKLLAVLVVVGAVALAAVALAAASTRAPIMVGAKLDAKQDHARSRGTGSFTGTITGRKLVFTLTFRRLTGPASAAHIHLGAKGVAGPVIVPLCGPCKTKVKGTMTLTAATLKAIRRGRTYVNVHTAKYPNGEIRGQLSAH